MTSTSLWIDEGFSAWIAATPSFGSLARAQLGAGALSIPYDRQYPLYQFWLWAWTHVFGSSEYALRAANLPFGALFVVSVALTSCLVFRRRFAWIPFVFSPFAWFYMNEARAYMMLIAFSTLATSAMLAYTFGPAKFRTRAIWVLFPSLFFAWLSQMLAALLFPGLVIIGILGLRSDRAFEWREWRGPVIVFGPLLVAVGIFYAGTLGASREIALLHGNGSPFAFAAEIIYEQAGFGGLGAPRNALRVAPLSALSAAYLPWLAIGVAGVAFVCYLAFRSPIDSKARAVLLAWAVSYALAVSFASLMSGRFLGRHVAALLPLFLFGAMAVVGSRRQCLAVAVVFIASDLRLSLLPDYGKDDYRNAVHDVLARNRARPGFIDWAADWYTASYYGLALGDRDAAAKDIRGYIRDRSRSGHAGVFNVANWSDDAVASLIQGQRAAGKPIYIAISKPDVFDQRLTWERTVQKYHAAQVGGYQSFAIFAMTPVQGANLRLAGREGSSGFGWTQSK